MTTTPKRLVPGSVLTGAAAVYYTAGALTRAVLRSGKVTNTTGAAVAVTIYIVPSGGAVGAATTLVSARSIAPGETYNCPELVNEVLEAGATIQAFGTGLTLTVSGTEII